MLNPSDGHILAAFLPLSQRKPCMAFAPKIDPWNSLGPHLARWSMPAADAGCFPQKSHHIFRGEWGATVTFGRYSTTENKCDLPHILSLLIAGELQQLKGQT